MATIKNEDTYNSIMLRIEELIEQVGEHTPMSDPRVMELDLLVDLAEEYEDEHYPIGMPALPDVIKLRMSEMNLTQEGLAKMLGLSQSRISDYLTGKTEPTLKVARAISKELNIEPGIVLGV
ncbi:helix-turn-helix domain-containing protein [Petrimonas sp.]|uniref:helix-turn-helix domain-containing protein n=1 Tax=Petrimonas sp. TaxID=2023866 RepID=UPI003F50F6D6